MTFLKVIVSIAVAVLLVVFLNVTMSKFFPVTSQYSRADKCNSLSPASVYPRAWEENATVNPESQEYKDAQSAYDKCQKEAADKTALANIYSWVRSIIVLLIVVAVSVLLFKRFPFFSSALIAGGLIFAISYPLFSSFGYDPTNDLSSNVKNQIDLIKIITTFIGSAALSAADLLFFEKEK